MRSQDCGPVNDTGEKTVTNGDGTCVSITRISNSKQKTKGKL